MHFIGLQLLRYSRETAARTTKRSPCAALLQVQNGAFKVFVLRVFSEVRQLQSLVGMLLNTVGCVPGLYVVAVIYLYAPRVSGAICPE